MNGEEFRVAGKQMVDYIADYLENIRERPVLPSVEPFYIRQVVPTDPPEKPEKWSDVFGDIEKVVMNGMTHWHSPYFYCYFPTGNSYPAILGGMLSDALSCIGFSWYSSPACTELEMQMCDWMAKALGLPEFYMFNNNGTMGNKGKGGGVIQGSISESTLVTMLAAKRIAVEKIRKAILKTAENRTKEEQKNLEQRNQRLKQGFLNLLKDVIRKADELQENNKFLNRNQLKDETSRLISSFFNKKDKTQETVNNKLISNLSLESTKSVESARFAETNQPTEQISQQQGKASKWNLNGNLRENDKVNSLNGLNRDKKANKDSEGERLTSGNTNERILTNGKMNGNEKANGNSNANDKRTNGNMNGNEKAATNGKMNGNEKRFSNGNLNGSHKPVNGDANGHVNGEKSQANGKMDEDENGDLMANARNCRCSGDADSSTETILDLHLQYLLLTDSQFSSDTAKLVVYCSDQAHSSVEKAALLSSVIVRKVKATPNEENDLGMDGLALEKAIIRDLECGLVPFYVCATLGTTSSLAFDKLDEVGLVTKKYDLWLHVDAAYAGSALVCPEYRHIMKGVEYTDSFGMNPHKWLLVNFDCSMLWVKDANHLERAMSVTPAYLKHEKEGQIPDYRHWQIPLGRRFRSLKVWFVMRMHGITGLQSHIRKQINLAIAFSNMIKANDRFELTHPVIMGLVCFRLKGTNELNEQLVSTINRRKKMHILSTIVSGQYIIRFAVCSRFTELYDIEIAYRELLDALEEVENPPIEESDQLNCIRN